MLKRLVDAGYRVHPQWPVGSRRIDLVALIALNQTATTLYDKSSFLTPGEISHPMALKNASILASLTGCYRPAINTFIEARKQRIDELNAAHGLGPGHNRATARTHPNAIPELVKRFKEEVLGQPF